MSRIEQIINEMEEYLDGCKAQAFSNSKRIVVEKDVIDDMLVELRMRTPEEIKKYQERADGWEKKAMIGLKAGDDFALEGGGSVPGDTRVAADTRVPGGGTALDSGTAPDSESTAVLVPGDLISLRRNFSMGDCITIASESDGVSLGMSSDRDSVYVYAREGLDKGRISAEN